MLSPAEKLPERSDDGRIRGITADDAMRANLPDIARARDRVGRHLRHIVSGILVGLV
jgi:hypothetical protein